ncbi:MAG: hypothetical protein BWZ11_00178 [Bacteroidetes bacterium ADurb.BinA395]|nr:MAG: hypothetical protein BWZ11_00178 [Bacteroidetes bacterium ADurb.BinA395]
MSLFTKINSILYFYHLYKRVLEQKKHVFDMYSKNKQISYYIIKL